VVSMHVRAEAASAAAVRAGLTADLAAHGLSADARNDVALVATELITNAIQHGQPLPSDELAVEWSTEGEDVLIRVTDGGGSSHPRLMSSGPDDTSGRGLAIVHSLASSWGVIRRQPCVRASLRLRRPQSGAGVTPAEGQS